MSISAVNVSIPDQQLTDVLVTDVASKGFIAEDILPTKTLTEADGMTGTFFKLGSEHIRKSQQTTVTANGAPAPRVLDEKRSEITYKTEVHSRGITITPEDRMNVSNPFDLRQERTVIVGNLLKYAKEFEVSEKLRDESNYDNLNKITLSGTQFFDDPLSTPLITITNATNRLMDVVGGVPIMIAPFNVFNFLSINPTVKDVGGFKFNETGRLSREQITTIFGVRKILIPEVLANTANEGQTDVIAPVWGEDVILAIVPDSLTTPSVTLGLRIQHGTPQIFTSILPDPVNTELLTAKDSYQYQFTNFLAAFLIKDALKP